MLMLEGNCELSDLLSTTFLHNISDTNYQFLNPIELLKLVLILAYGSSNLFGYDNLRSTLA